MFLLLLSLGIIILIIANFVMGLSKNRKMNILYLVLSSILTLIGVIGIAITINDFHTSLLRRLNNNMLDSEFATWARDEFMGYVIISFIITVITILLLILITILSRKNHNNILVHSITPILIITRFILVMFALVYSYGTINKFFDIAGYITSLAIFECFILYLPSIYKKIIYLNYNNNINHNGE